MKNSFILFFLFLFLSVGVFTACNNDDDDPTPAPITNQCNTTSTFPATTGGAGVSFINFPGATAVVNATANAGDVLSIAVKLLDGPTTRPQKLRVFASGCENEKGTQVSFSGQPQTEDNGMTIDLRNVSDQVRTVLYTVPSGVSPLYLNFEVDESGSKYTYKRLKITVSGSGIIDSWSSKVLGSQNNAEPSRMSSSTGYVYKACETEANINTIDITYAVGASDSKNYISSNPARFQSPIGLSTNSVNCGVDEGTLMTNGGNPVYFITATGVNFNDATDATINALAITNSNNQYVEVVTGGIYGFLRSDGKKGLVRVNSISAAGTNGVTDKTINLDVKVQR